MQNAELLIYHTGQEIVTGESWEFACTIQQERWAICLRGLPKILINLNLMRGIYCSMM